MVVFVVMPIIRSASDMVCFVALVDFVDFPVPPILPITTVRWIHSEIGKRDPVYFDGFEPAEPQGSVMVSFDSFEQRLEYEWAA